MQPNYRIVLSPTIEVSGVPLISWSHADCATKPELKRGSSNSNELWSTVCLQFCFPFTSCLLLKVCAPCFSEKKRYFLLWFSLCRQSKVNFKVISDVATGTVFSPLSPCRAIYSISGSHGGFRCITVCVLPVPKDTLGMLSALGWYAGGCCWNGSWSWVPALLLTSKKEIWSCLCRQRRLHQGDRYRSS